MKWKKYPENIPEDEKRYVILYRYKDIPELRLFIADYDPVEERWRNTLDDITIVYYSEVSMPVEKNDLQIEAVASVIDLVASHLDPQSKHPTNGEIVEFLNIDGVRMYGKASKNGISIARYSDGGEHFLTWGSVDKIVRIIDDQKQIKITPPEEWGIIEFHDKLHLKCLKRITREEVENERK